MRKIILAGLALSLAACTAGDPYGIVPGKPIGDFRVFRSYIKGDVRLVPETRSDIPAYARFLYPAPQMTEFILMTPFRDENNSDRMILQADRDGRVTAIVGYFRATPRRSSRISRFTRRLWRKFGGGQPRFGTADASEPQFSGAGTQAHFRAGPVHGAWLRSGGYDTIYLLLE